MNDIKYLPLEGKRYVVGIDCHVDNHDIIVGEFQSFNGEICTCYKNRGFFHLFGKVYTDLLGSIIFSEDYLKALDYTKNNNYVNLSLSDLKSVISEYFNKKEPNIVVFSDDKIFSVTINKTVNTGKGGLKLYLKDIPDSIQLKISFNGTILNEEQYKQFKEMYGK